MKSFKITRLIVAVFMFVMASLAMSAQTSGDKLYNQGLEFQKVQTIRSQRNAIAKFRSAKKLYDSQAKKDQCDKAIAVSNNIISILSNPSAGNKSGTSESETAKKEQALSISNDRFGIDCHAKTLTVTVAAINIDDWNAMPLSNADGTSFLTVKKGSDGSSILIDCDANASTTQREQSVEVSGGDIKKTIKITQKGLPVDLSTNKSMVEYGKNGGKKSIEIYCNSTNFHADNSNQNWIIESKPDWIYVVVETEQKKKGGLMAKMKEKMETIVNGTVDTAGNSDMRTSTIVVNADKIAKGTPDYNNGRKGELVIASDDQTVTILIVQK